MGFFDYFRRRGRAAGLPAQHPFLDLDLIELVLRLPPEHGFDPYISRPLVRRAMRGIVPEEVRTRRDKTYFDPLLVDCVGGEDRRLVMRLLGAPDAEVLSVADGAGVRALLDRGPSRHPQRAPSWTRDVWRLATAECWLRTQADPTFPRTLLEGVPRTAGGTNAQSPRTTESSVSQS
jgi:asparagine synthetase B (glutamine-hydrolysing)